MVSEKQRISRDKANTIFWNFDINIEITLISTAIIELRCIDNNIVKYIFNYKIKREKKREGNSFNLSSMFAIEFKVSILIESTLWWKEWRG